MSEKPIIFSGEMVRAILDDRKTQTRRVIIKPQPVLWEGLSWEWEPKGKSVYAASWPVDRGPSQNMLMGAPYQIGDRLWVRETLQRGPRICPETFHLDTGLWGITYRSDLTPVPYREGAEQGWCGRAVWQWKKKALPSIFMPKWATRIWLEVTGVRAERVQDISYDDILAEGWDVGASEPMTDGTAGEDARAWFVALWDKLNAGRGFSFSDKCWVFAYTFRQETP